MASKSKSKEKEVEKECGSGDSGNDDIDVLQSQGIQAADIKKLKAAGIGTVKGLMMMPKKHLANIKGLSEAKVDKLKEAVNKQMAECIFKTASEIREDRKQIFRISTGASTLDTILGGGIESQCLTEVHGEFRCGKTQLSHTLCVTCQVPNKEANYPGGKALFIDTEHTFRPERLEQIALRFDLDPVRILDNVVVVRCYTTDQQIEMMELVAAKFYEDRSFKLIIVDSVMALFRAEFNGRGELSERQQKLGQFLARLQKIAEEFNVAVFLTNQMTACPTGMTMGPAMMPIGGHILAHAAAWRLQLSKAKVTDRKAKIVDSPEMPEAEAKYSIGEGGIGEPSEKD